MTIADLPTLNACLNGIATLLLLAGYDRIRRRQIGIEQGELAAGVAQALGQHREPALEAGLVGALQALLLVGEQLQREQRAADEQAQKDRAQQQAAAEGQQLQARPTPLIKWPPWNRLCRATGGAP